MELGRSSAKQGLAYVPSTYSQESKHSMLNTLPPYQHMGPMHTATDQEKARWLGKVGAAAHADVRRLKQSPA
jgi:hypothetical protein